MFMKLVVGLGNPESEYVGTRHNIGKFIVDETVCSIVGDPFSVKKLLKSVRGIHECGEWKDNQKLNVRLIKLTVDGCVVMFAKPLRYMNDSGVVIRDVMHFYKIDPSNTLVVYDDLDLVVGKVSLGSPTKVHNGVYSILDTLGKREFNKISFLKVGVREKKIPMSVKKFGLSPNKYVLSKFPKEDKLLIENEVKMQASNKIISWLSK